jgi:hypothetical protein
VFHRIRRGGFPTALADDRAAMTPEFKPAPARQAAVGFDDGIVVNTKVYGMVRSMSRPRRSLKACFYLISGYWGILGGGQQCVAGVLARRPLTADRLSAQPKDSWVPGAGLAHNLE